MGAPCPSECKCHFSSIYILGGLFAIDQNFRPGGPILDSITRMDVYVIFVEVVNKMASKCTINGETPPDFLALPP